MPLCTQVDLGSGDIVLDLNPASTKGHSPSNLQPMSVVAKRLDGSSLRMPLGTEVDIGPSHIVLDGAQLPRQGAQQPLFRAHVYSGQMVAHLIYR